MNGPPFSRSPYRRTVRPDIIVIELGDNDILSGRINRRGGEFVKDYLEFIHYIRSELLGEDVHITTLTPILWVEGISREYLQEWTARLQELILEVSGKSGPHLLDVYGPLWQAVRQAPWMIPDGIHPNKNGARIIACAVYSALREKLF